LLRDTGESYPEGLKSGEQEGIRCRVYDSFEGNLSFVAKYKKIIGLLK
jgi:hypothetical protein